MTDEKTASGLGRIEKVTDSAATLCLQAIGSVVEPRSALYAAGPLETGRIFYEHKAGDGLSDGGVRRANQARLTSFVARLRHEFGRPVIDPGLLVVQGWEGNDYGEFFLEVIRRFAAEVRFIEGWEYSSGATKEYLLCVETGVPCFDECGAALLVDRAEALMRAAADHMRALGFSDERLQRRLRTLADAVGR